jgi:hypothetical protein
MVTGARAAGAGRAEIKKGDESFIFSVGCGLRGLCSLSMG